jgi:hypothetical protein
MNEYYQIRNINNAGFCKAVYVLQNETLFYKLLAER